MTAVVFPGQGSQIKEMSKDFYDNFQIAKKTFEEIEDFVKLDLKKIIFENQDNMLNRTKYTQISIFTSSMLIFNTLIDEQKLDLNSIKYMLGHSLGEYTALACSRKLNLEQVSLILKKRGELMDNAVEPNISGMAALIGNDSEYINKIIKDYKLNVEIANDNSPLQVVISGSINNILASEKIFLKNNIKKFVKLNVSAAFHSSLMNDAQEQLSKEIDKLNFIENNIEIISNFNAEISSDNSNIILALKKQMANKVMWTKSIRKLDEKGVGRIIEIGPGKVLSSLIKRITNNIEIQSYSSVSDLK